MKLEGRKIVVNKSADQLVEMLKNPEDYKALMPDSLQNFEARDNGFKFGLKGMPEIKLKKKEQTPFSKVVLGAASDKLPFTLTADLNAISENVTELQLYFEGEFNAMMAMMIKGPIGKFIETLANNMHKL